MQISWPENCIVRDEEPIARHLPLRGGGAVDHWVEVPDEASLLLIIKQARALKIPLRPIPAFHDALPPEGGIPGIAIRLGSSFENIESREEGIYVGAAAPLAWVGLYGGHSSFLRAPGTLSDAIEDGWIAPALIRVRRLNRKAIEEVEATEYEPKALVLGALIRRQTRITPVVAGTAFRELKVRGGLTGVLSRARLTGIRVHGACLAADSPAVLVNRGDADPRHLRLLMTAVRERAQAVTGHTLEDRLGQPGRGFRL